MVIKVMVDLENKQQGWILLHRSILCKGWDSDTIHLWVYLLLNANIKETNYNLIKVMRGQLLTGRDKLELNTGINQSKIERILKYFESEQQIEQQKTNKYRIITIKNYDEYQNVNNKMNNSQQQNNNKKHIINKDNNVKECIEEKDNSIELSKKKKFIVPSVEDIKKYCEERGNNINAQSFFDHYEVRGWIPKGYTRQMSDWKAAVRTWEKQSNSFSSDVNIFKKPVNKTHCEKCNDVGFIDSGKNSVYACDCEVGIFFNKKDERK